MAPSLQTLFLPFEQGLVQTDQASALFLGARWHPFLADMGDVQLWQPFYPAADTLMAHGLHPLPSLPAQKTYSLVLVDVPKQVEEAQFWIAHAAAILQPGGVLVIAAANDAGGNRLVKWMTSLGFAPESLSKNKARVVWGVRPRTISPIADEWFENGGICNVVMADGGTVCTQPGIFGWNKIDAGSRLLADLLPSDLGGTGADYGCGWGYLSSRLLEKTKAMEDLYLLEADSRALACAKNNLENVRGSCTLHPLWTDATNPAENMPPLDFIIMNPPFHEGKKTDLALGQGFIESASRALKKNGRLWMVANAHLPYEKILVEKFVAVEKVTERDGFKVFSCRK